MKQDGSKQQLTGASPEQIEAAAAIAWNDTGATVPITDMDQDNRFVRERRADALLWASRLVPPGYRIVPADAVVVTPEVAATAAEACGEVATNWDNDADFNDDDEGFRAEANRYRAAAAALRGEG